MNEFIKKYKDHKFGSFTVVGPEEYVMDMNGNITQKNVYCHCDCGKQWVVVGISDLLNGNSTSCGCQGKDTFVRVVNSGNMGHGDSKGGLYHSLYLAWKGMRGRVRYMNKSLPSYRQIVITPEWDNYLSFKDWALQNGWCDSMTIRRRDTSKGYNPENCYWSY